MTPKDEDTLKAFTEIAVVCDNLSAGPFQCVKLRRGGSSQIRYGLVSGGGVSFGKQFSFVAFWLIAHHVSHRRWKQLSSSRLANGWKLNSLRLRQGRCFRHTWFRIRVRTIFTQHVMFSENSVAAFNFPVKTVTLSTFSRIRGVCAAEGNFATSKLLPRTVRGTEAAVPRLLRKPRLESHSNIVFGTQIYGVRHESLISQSRALETSATECWKERAAP